MTQRPARHVACIMDGGAAWPGGDASDRVPAAETGVAAAVDAAVEAGVRWLTLLPAAGSGGPRKVLEPVLDAGGERLHGRGVRVGLLGGATSALTGDAAQRLRRVRELTVGNTGLRLTLALTHDGREALPATLHALIAGGEAGDMAERLQKETGLPPVDLLIRTGGRHRLSGALPWHCADAELVFLDVPWAGFTAEHFRQALELYRLRRGLDGPPPSGDAAVPAVGAAAPRSPVLEAAAKATGLLRAAVSVPARVPRPPAGSSDLAALPAEVTAHLVSGLRETVRFTRARLAEILAEQVAGPERCGDAADTLFDRGEP
ncbi:hypothetical protein Acsp04_21270 [Actinomadura sp. NBRC 104425]|uniref:undecaprenyl diphosphate synthase family protein n=1 Tax=Actinomadura sp. NBRC 104425 TaxID=3032204 RepID=UPI0024A3A70C|nr:undecaprenyl diphosphate synthase family protein [Actinomadura sp. NBRC 104425]GLZ11892.1 hypothetical protein Acsp04_21270 [Actinomadura sp. NBRC 104425]